MTVLDPGHRYELHHFDGSAIEVLQFVKREGPGYPGNCGHYEGTNIQEVLRALIERLQYLDKQIHHRCNDVSIYNLRNVIRLLEIRAAERHGRPVPMFTYDIETMPTCVGCGHIGCSGECYKIRLEKGAEDARKG